MTRLSLALAALVLTACSAERPAEADVRSRFDAFERALRADDVASLCDLVTRESLPALEQVAPGSARRRGALAIEAVRRRDPSCYEVDVREATGDAVRGTFAVVKEDGVWRVDLVESAAITHGTVAAPPTIEPAGLTPEQIDGIRANHRERVQ